MSEHQPSSHEGHKPHEQAHGSGEHLARIEKSLKQKAELARNESTKENLKEIAEKAELHAESASNIRIDRHADNEPDTVLGVQHALKSDAYLHTLRSVRRKLPKPARVFSKIAHNNIVDAVSEISAKTIARPSGFLGGSLFAFAGSMALLYYSRHYGFAYNYALFLLLFAAGFAAGVAAELVIWAIYSRKHRR